MGNKKINKMANFELQFWFVWYCQAQPQSQLQLGCSWWMTMLIGVFKGRRQGGPKRFFLLICFDDMSNSVPTNGKSVPTMLLLSLPGGATPMLFWYIQNSLTLSYFKLSSGGWINENYCSTNLTLNLV